MNSRKITYPVLFFFEKRMNDKVDKCSLSANGYTCFHAKSLDMSVQTEPPDFSNGYDYCIFVRNGIACVKRQSEPKAREEEISDATSSASTKYMFSFSTSFNSLKVPLSDSESSQECR